MTIEIITRKAQAPATGPALLFIHGAYAGAWCWDAHFLPYLAGRGCDTYAVSLRGHGRSDGREHLDSCSLEDYVADVVIAAAKIGRPMVLVGHSMGAIVAQRAARRCGAVGLILMAPVPPHGLSSSAFMLAMRDPQLFMGLAAVQASDDWGSASSRVKEWLFSSDTPDEWVRPHLRHMQHESQRALADLAWPQYFWIRDSVGLPALLMGGESDVLFSAPMLMETALVHGVSPLILPGLAHALMLEQNWKTAADAILEWLAGRSWKV
jgi:pimeloyl-ACP methyl ester carboxylesterase